MKKGIKIFSIILLVIIILGIVFFIIDYNRVKNNNTPMFCINTGTLRDGGSVEYLGLGYKVIDFNTLDEYDDIKIGTWFMNYDDFQEEMKSSKNEVGEKNEEENIVQTFNARIEEITDNSNMLVNRTDMENGEYYINIRDYTKITFNGENISVNDLKIGDNISITYSDKYIDLAYPPTIREVQKIEVLSE